MFKSRTILSWTILCVFLAGTAFADVYMKQQITTSDSKEGPQIQETWMTATKVRSNTGDRSSIFDAEKNVLISLDHKKKKYMEIPLNFTGGASQEEQQNMDNLPSFMRNMMKMEVTVQPTDEQKKIGDWNCKKYLQTLKVAMTTSESEIWASEDIHVNTDVYKKFSAAFMASQPGFYKMLKDMMKESEKIKGIPVLQTTTSKIMKQTITSTTELLEVKEMDAPADLFEIPAGYKQEKFKEE